MFIKKTEYSLLNIIRITFTSSPGYSSLFIFFKILDGLVPSLEILALASFIDKALSIVQKGEAFSYLYLPTFLVILCLSYMVIGSKCSDLIKGFMTLIMKEKLRDTIQGKRARLRYLYVEDPESWDLISRVTDEPELKVLEGFRSLLTLVSIIVRVVGILIIIYTQVWWAALIIIIVAIPLFFISANRGKAEYETDREVSELRRKDKFLDGILTDRETVEERTLFGITSNVNKRWYALYQESFRIIMKTKLTSYIRMKAGGITTSLFSIFVILNLLNPVLSKEISLGLFMSLVNAVFGLSSILSWILARETRSIAKAREYMRDLASFFDYEEEDGVLEKPTATIPAFDSIEFRNVRFRYPGTDPWILNGLSFTMTRDRHYALVGINGAGKTTIIKLITGLYKEYEGEIILNGKELKEYVPAELKAYCSVVYQDFARYNISLRDNIALGRPDEEPGTQEEKVAEVLDELDMSDAMSHLPQGQNTLLGKAQEGGMDISGGEWQRVAMARGIISTSPLRILDEPTAALDPISESRLYSRYEEISREGTTIFISHRLGSTKLADEILVISEGVLSEQGSHEDLLEQQGVYAEMFENQKEWFK